LEVRQQADVNLQISQFETKPHEEFAKVIRGKTLGLTSQAAFIQTTRYLQAKAKCLPRLEQKQRELNV